MFGFGKKKETGPIGAKEKIRRAQAMIGGDGENIDSKREGDGGDEAAIALVIVYGMSAALALLLTQGALAKGVPFRLPSPDLQRWLLGNPVPAVTGSADINTIIAVLARGAAIFLLAGLVPLVAKILHLVWRRKDGQLWLFWLALILVLTAGVAYFRLY